MDFEALLGLLLATGTTDIVGLSTLRPADVASIPASPAVAKGAVATFRGRAGTASWLPARTDPASTSMTN
ncbi:hypothetical protein [Streptomyces sp. STR69]|uniref:hypothetical protein n=1 Tax=Streptomyces sp. STR69 TaxID=1796942 RepID=UPI0021CA4AB8|nr:hypothetical protein [Streptomyces sp. STR69]